MLNRAALIVRPKQPFFEWAEGLDDSGLVPDAEGEQTVYLIPSFDTEEEAWAIIEDLYSEIFDNELWSWHTVPADWPAERTFATFCEWFDLELHSVIEDLGDDALLDDDEE